MGTLEAEAQAEAVPRPGAPHFLVHNEGDHVGVAVQDVEPGQALIVFMDSERADQLEVLERVPLGHKVALSDLEEGADVIEYAVPVGRTRQPVRRGQWVHVHNLRSRRWEKSE
jgi:(2R)-sulfolactate sulfo-lyase subunit alpha